MILLLGRMTARLVPLMQTELSVNPLMWKGYERRRRRRRWCRYKSKCVRMRACVCWANGGHDETTDRQTGLSLHIPRRRRRQKQSIHPSRSYYLLKRCQSISLSLSPQSLTHSVTHPLYDKSTVCVCGLSLQIESRGKHTHTHALSRSRTIELAQIGQCILRKVLHMT